MPPTRWLPWIIAGVYAIIAGLWVLLSDRVADAVVTDPDQLTRVQTIKGWAFVVTTAFVLFGLSCWFLRRISLASKELESQAFQTQGILRSSVDGIITITAQGIIASANPAAERLFDHEAKDMLGNNVSMLMPEPYHSEHDGYITNYIQTGNAKIIGIGREVVGKRSDSSTFPMELAVSEFNADGQRMFTGIVRDISERVRLEKELLEISNREQRRIGRDLHDGLGQDLTGIAMLGRALQKKLATSAHEDAATAAEIEEIANRTRSNLRNIVRGLNPISLEDGGFMDALRNLTNTAEEIFGVTCLLECDKVIDIEDRSVAEHLYYVAKEAVNNAVRHGHPHKIVVHIDVEDESRSIRLTISDDGKGISGDWHQSRGNGLRTMAYRARVVGGTFDVRRVEGGGVEVICTAKQFS